MNASSLASAVGLSAEQTQSLRREGVKLLEGKHWERARDVVLGLIALGEVHPADPLILAVAYQALGLEPEARACLEHARRLHEGFGLAFSPPAFLGGLS
jgi:hypothetical protein